MNFVLGVLTVLLVINCLLLILLVLVQLPKKDAGAGMAFGAGTADALFGAGSGNTLTQITKYTAIVFLVLSLFLGYLQSKARYDSGSAKFSQMVEEKQNQSPAAAPVQSPKPQPTPSAANNLLSTLPVSATNATVPAVTNSAK
jgi:preprotein translocase subunit SecG